jgi:hypothetical protein
MSFLSLDNVNRKKFYNSGGGRWWGKEKKFSFFASSAPDFSTHSQHRTRLNHGKR